MTFGTANAPAVRARVVIVFVSLFVVGSVITGCLPVAPPAGISSASDYPTPGRFPWGTAFDASGRVWVALPGCDPSPSCSSSTPPGKLGLFDPTTSTWTTTVSLPAGYGQPLFVAPPGRRLAAGQGAVELP